MVYASRSRTALSSVPQNHTSDIPSAASLSTKSNQSRLSCPFTYQANTAKKSRRSLLCAKLAHTSSALLHSPSLAKQAACIVDIPVHVAPPFSMQVAQLRAGLKRKKDARNQLGREPPGNAKSSDRSSAGVDSLEASHVRRSAVASTSQLRRTGSHASRTHKDRGLDNIITSPYLPRDKPASSASELSDWSSVASVSPTTSRAPHSRFDDASAAAVAPARPGIQTRRSGRNLLHRTMDGMTLEDSLPVGLGLGVRRSSRSQSASMSRQSSSQTAGRPDGSPGRSCTTKASQRSGASPDSDHSSSASPNMDDEEAEHARLISSAPNWQLHRLRKDELIDLSTKAGAWQALPAEDELELLTKQDLVNQIITCRSRLDRSQSITRKASASLQRPHRSSKGAHLDDMHDQNADDTSGLWMGSSSRRASHRLNRRSRDISSSNSADDREEDHSEASNEAGGEETEAEPQRSSSMRRHNGRLTSTQARLKSDVTLRRMDSSTFDELEPSKTNQAPRRQLRDKASLKGAIKRRLRIADGSEALSASTSSSIFGGGRSSHASNTSPLPFVHRQQQHNVFIASSPVRTRSRSARATLNPPHRRKAGARGFSGSDAGLSSADPMATPKLGNHRTQRARKTVQFNAAASIATDVLAEDEWMEDLSTDSEAVAAALQPPSADVVDDHQQQKASRRVLRARRSTADSETSLSSHRPRSRSVSAEAPSDDRIETAEHIEDDVIATSDDDNDAPTPTKFRKLRNGKLRLIAGSSRLSSDDVSPEPGALEDDVDMESATESHGRSGCQDGSSTSRGVGRKQRSESPESGIAPSESLENAMVQPTFTTLSRLRKLELEQLCLHREIDIDDDDKKANLIKKLLDWNQLTEIEAAATDGSDTEADQNGTTVRPSHDADADETRSDVSTATATAEDETAKAGQRTPTRRRATRAASNTHPEATDSDQPLLLRARGKAVSSDKLPTPPLTSNNDEANPPQAGNGIDELNGLDLEGLNLTDKEIHPSKLEKLEKIGSGGFKDVYVGKYRISKTRVNKVAIADIRDQLTEMDIKELSLLRDLRHENIVRFIGVSIPEDPRHVPCMIVSELCSNGDLFDYIRNIAAPCDAEVFRILLETARGLEYLHTRTPAIIHRDCKSTNVLITRRKTAKINDFGLARVKNTSRSMMKSLVGTVNWQAVELWVPKPHYNEKVDVWSAAMTFWEALQWHQPEKKYPFQGMNEHQIYQDVGQKRQRPYTGFIRRQFGGEIVDLLDRMWDQTPKNRPTMTEVCNELEALIQMKKDAAAASNGRSKA
ncbi:hypothetical protein NDA11_006688 [Ustilago hordei]|nr:hypothetical protein NDA10_002562 [Ustilago hordei]KAJ1579176.1 hypothetical protein NDA15_007439 [Ustilago hordei]KAJ1580528.1 hypothetical protein NDA12_001164 [Ustilago hordei]KAJ1581610.1 hypothetical protein NDA11_006688 [Ustilago hordei]